MKTNASPLSVDIIQGGMGVGISDWRLAWTVSCLGEALGTVSGTALERVLPLILGNGDPGGHIRRALAHFPFPEIAELVLNEYYIPGGWKEGMPRKGAPIFNINSSRLYIALTVCANYAYVWLAKEGHEYPISINYLDKIGPHVHALTGAVLAHVDYVTMGAGMPLKIPTVMRDIVEGRECHYDMPVIGDHIRSHSVVFDPAAFFGGALPLMEVPGFLPIIASNLLADIFMKKLDDPHRDLAGFALEDPTAGGHNAPPRTKVLDEDPESVTGTRFVYGYKDVVNHQRIADLGLPFWIGGSYASPEKLAYARSVGAQGIQVGSIFALSASSGLREDIRKEVCKRGFNATLHVETDYHASPTGFPFKVVALEGTMSEKSVRDGRVRSCDQGALRVLYEKSDGAIGYRCPAEPIDAYLAKGGKLEDTVDRCCLCNGLVNATAWGNMADAAIVTLGDDVGFLKHLMVDENTTYTAAQAVAYLRGT